MEFVAKENEDRCREITDFISKHEWLGKMPRRPTHRFIATYRGHLAGVVIMATPNCFSNLLGKHNRHLEKLISRGACISWSPKNLGSALVMFAVKWMAKNTEFRYFTAYSDTEAGELGTIYQACNFTYLGQTSGARFEYFDPEDQGRNPFSDRLFRKTSFIKRKAIEAGISWQSSWHQGDKIIWNNIPESTKGRIREAGQSYIKSCRRRPIPPKHKYVYILGSSKRETKELKTTFQQLNPGKLGLPYPKIRGPVAGGDTTEESQARPRRIASQELTKRPNPCWPSRSEQNAYKKKFYSIKEVSTMFGISSWLIYHHIKTDPTFPVVNVGIKKRFLIEPTQFEAWVEEKTKKFKQAEHRLISSAELLECK